MPREPNSDLPTITVYGTSSSFDIYGSRSVYDYHRETAEFQRAGTVAGTAAAARLFGGRNAFTFAELLKWGNRFRRAATFNPTPAAVGALLTEAAVIAGIKYFEQKPPLSPEETALAALLVEQANSMFFATSYAQDLFVSGISSDGALSDNEARLLEQLTGLSWDPTPVPVPIQNAQGYTLTSSFRNNELQFAFTPATFDKTLNQLAFTPITKWTIDAGTYQGQPITQSGLNSTGGSVIGDTGIRSTRFPAITTTAGSRYPGRTIIPARTVSYEHPMSDLMNGLLKLPGFADTVMNGDISVDIADVLMDALPEFIPTTSINVTGQTKEWLNVVIRANTKTQARAITEANTLRKDKKRNSKYGYVAALNLINKTFGRVTELDDLSLALQDNLIFQEDTKICTGITDSDTCIIVKAGQALSELPLKYKGPALGKIFDDGYGSAPTELNFEGFLLDYAQMQVTDISMALATQLERQLINQVFDSNPLTDYGNLSTWVRRANAWKTGIEQLNI